jgi:hypothetical protein
MTKNRFGLSRHIPASVTLDVRRRSKFGCVNCRCAIYQYEHIDPQFADAQSHNSENICLLCGGCHDSVTRGRLSKETIRHKYQKIQTSVNERRPFEQLDLSASALSVSLGSCIFHQAKALFRINGENIVSINPPSNGAAFPTLSGIFYDRFGIESFRIIENTWEGRIDSWDIEVVGSAVTIKAEAGRIALKLVISPPDHVTITHLDMYKDNCHIVCKDGELLVGQIKNFEATYIALGSFQCRDAEVGVCVDSRHGEPVHPIGLRMIGGQGVSFDGTGIQIGVGAAQMHVGQVRLWAA